MMLICQEWKGHVETEDSISKVQGRQISYVDRSFIGNQNDPGTPQTLSDCQIDRCSYLDRKSMRNFGEQAGNQAKMANQGGNYYQSGQNPNASNPPNNNGSMRMRDS